jgi:5-oxoprolinase (ATP-hydrolysing)
MLSDMNSVGWQFFMDVGGTFTDVVARRLDGTVTTYKLLSTGVVRGRVGTGSTTHTILDHRRRGERDDLWRGYRLRLVGPDGPLGDPVEIVHSNGADGSLHVASPLPIRSGPLATPDRQDPAQAEPLTRGVGSPCDRGEAAPRVKGGSRGSGEPHRLETGATPQDRDRRLERPATVGAEARDRDPPDLDYELRSSEEAPVTAIRHLMQLRLDEPIGSVEVRLGTTRATNALLERKGAPTVFVTTRGFADVLKIGYQDRPDLFRLDIRKRDELPTRVVEIDERLGPRGEVLTAPRPDQVRSALAEARAAGCTAAAICLLHAHVNPAHEDLVADIADELGFDQVSVSSRVARLEGIVPRGDTTVVDAYLGPVIRRYVAAIRASLPEARIWLMTSVGGLLPAGAVGGKDTLLSGPAGGVVGCAAVARRVGVDQAIGFDMGGTSTDVARVEFVPASDAGRDGAPPASAGRVPRFEYQHETVKAGVRLMTPMLAVETVASGGGSICAFDGHMLTVGPHSAGADPGPACYGRGGPLTLTDVNVFLGRVPPACFPFPLVVAPVHRRLEELREQVRTAGGASMTPIELAEGFVDIANQRMASAIKRISIARGYDVRDAALVSFGGAGGQHACAVARMLGIRRILHSPHAGVLSAVGIASADVRRIAERAVRFNRTADTDTGTDTHSEARPLAVALTEMTDDLRRTMDRDGIDTSPLRPPVWSVDACYAGQSTVLTVPAEPWGEIGPRFERVHRREYGYVHEGRAVEVRVLRVELTAPAGSAPLEELHSTSGDPRSGSPLPHGRGSERGRRGVDERGPLPHGRGSERGRRGVDERGPLPHGRGSERGGRAVFDGAECAVPLLHRREMVVGDRVTGPALVLQDTSTVVIEPGWVGKVIPGGVLVLEDDAALVCGRSTGRLHRGARPPAVPDGSTEADPIRLELFNHRFASIAEQMGVTLRRTAVSTNVKERLDYSCAIFTPSGELVVNAPHIPVHLGAMSDCVKALIEDVPCMEPGDVYVTNDPYRGGSHLNDVTVVTPVHDDAGERLLFFVASRAHHAEIGGTRPGSMPPDSRCLAEEGVVLRALRFVAGGRERAEDLCALLTSGPYPSRAADENLADVVAQVAANRTGARELLGLIERDGLPVVQAYMGHIRRAAARKMRAALARLPDGLRRFEDRLDDGAMIRLTLTIRGERAIFDFSGTDAVLPGNLNANPAIVTSAVLYALRCLIDEDIPLNAGVLEPVEIVLPTCFLNPPFDADPARCPAVVGGNVETSQRIVDVILGALGVAAASQGTMNNVILGNERFGYYETVCGGAGAGPTFPGADAVHTHMTNTRITDPEVIEARYPLRIVRFAIRRGSGGGGRWPGGDGAVREIECLEPMLVSLLTQRRTIAPYGAAGGQPGAMGRNVLRRANGATETLPSIAFVAAGVGDRIIIETPGGGGWGRSSGESEAVDHRRRSQHLP